LAESWKSLSHEVNNCQEKMLTATSSANFMYEEKLELRAWAINLAGRCSQAAVIASSGAANYQHHTAGRIYREALLFSVSGQTTDVMEKSLKKLLADN
jgi:hypothetical protein